MVVNNCITPKLQKKPAVTLAKKKRKKKKKVVMY